MIVLDTHAWIWLLSEPSLLPDGAMSAINESDTIAISAISVWELSMLVKRGRLKLNTSPVSFVSATERDARFSIVSVDAWIAAEAVRLKDIHKDPADRLILATATSLGSAIVSKDTRFPEYGVAPVIW